MSNFDSKLNLNSKLQKKIDPTTNLNSPKSLKNLKWRSIQTDLKSALNEWTAVENNDIQKTPEEIQLDKVKTMIENIKEKLNQF